jgi:predicted transcriptional regulator
MVKNPIMTKKQSDLYIIAVICTKLEQRVPAEDIRKSLDLENDLFLSYIEFALENNWIIKQDNGRYKLTNYGKEFVGEFRSS